MLKGQNGRIHNAIIGDVMIWKIHEFHAWWNKFEALIDHPLSRTLINALIDHMELERYIAPKRGLFGMNKFRTQLNILSSNLGWGCVDLESHQVTNSAQPLCSVALAQYALETLDQCRYKARWVEPHPLTVQLELDRSQNPMIPPNSNRAPWSNPQKKSTDGGVIIEIDSVKNNALRLDGERVMLVPANAIERFVTACSPYAHERVADKFSWTTTMEPSTVNLLQATIESVTDMFLQSESPVYIIDESSWNSYIEHYISHRGWGTLNDVDYDEGTFVLKVRLNKIPLFPFAVGMLTGMWHRAHGRFCRVSIEEFETDFRLKFESFLDYQNP